MKLNREWRSMFGRNDLARGEDYYYDGAVLTIRQTPRGWTGKVCGSETYETFVPADPDELEFMSCDCPRFDHGYFCKHLAATCLAIESGDAIDETSSAASGNDLSNLVSTVAEQEVRSFLLDMLLHDSKAATRFVRRYGVVDAKVACQQLAAQLKDAAYDFSYRGYINYRNALGFERQYLDIMHTSIDPIVERGDLALALDLSLQALRSLERVSIDDSEGFFSSIIDDVEHLWKHWLGSSDEFDMLLFQRISDYLLAEPKDDEEYDIYSYAADMAWHFQVEHFVDCSTYSKHFVKLADHQLGGARISYNDVMQRLSKVRERQAKMGTPQGRTYAKSRHTEEELRRKRSELEFYAKEFEQTLTRWALIRLRALRAGGMDENALRAEAEPYTAHEGVCLYCVDMALERNDVEDALGLLRNCKAHQQALADGVYSPKVSERMVELLTNENADELREELMHLICHAPYANQKQSVRELWMSLRECYDGTLWPTEREGLLERITNDGSRRECLAAEGLYDQLMDDVEENGIYALSPYEEELVAHCPERVLGLYIDKLTNSGNYPGNDRRAYRNFAQLLLHVRSLPGGERPVDLIVQTMRERYARRPALMDELSVLMV